MSDFSIEFNGKALKEWQKLDASIRLQFARKLKERMLAPRVEADRLRSLPGCYKIKLRSAGYRLVYQVIEQRLVITVIAVGKRDRSFVYHAAEQRLS